MSADTNTNNAITASNNNNNVSTTALADQIYASAASSSQSTTSPTGLKYAIDCMLNYAQALQGLEGAVAALTNSLYESLSEFSQEENEDMAYQTTVLDKLPAGDTGNSQEDADNNKAITDQQALMQQHQTLYQNQISEAQAEAELVQSSTSSIASSLAALFNNTQSITGVLTNVANNM